MARTHQWWLTTGLVDWWRHKKKEHIAAGKVDTMESTMQDAPFPYRKSTYGTNAPQQHGDRTWEPSLRSRPSGDRGARGALIRAGRGLRHHRRPGGNLMVNRTEHLEVLLAAPSMGAVFQPLNRQLADDRVIHHQSRGRVSSVTRWTPTAWSRCSPLPTVEA